MGAIRVFEKDFKRKKGGEEGLTHFTKLTGVCLCKQIFKCEKKKHKKDENQLKAKRYPLIYSVTSF